MAEISSTFIIRLWTVDEPLAGESPRGRGRIDHVQSGEHIYFDQLAEALSFLRQHFGAYANLEGIAPPEPAVAPDSQASPTTMEEQST